MAISFIPRLEKDIKYPPLSGVHRYKLNIEWFFGSDIWRSFSATLLKTGASLRPNQFAQCFSSQILSISKAVDSTSFLGNLFWCLTTVITFFFFISSQIFNFTNYECNSYPFTLDLREDPGSLFYSHQVITGRSYIPFSSPSGANLGSSELSVLPCAPCNFSSHLTAAGPSPVYHPALGKHAKIGTLFQMKPHESWIEGGKIFSWPVGYLLIISVSQCTLMFISAVPSHCLVFSHSLPGLPVELLPGSHSLWTLHLFAFSSIRLLQLLLQLVKVSLTGSSVNLKKDHPISSSSSLNEDIKHWVPQHQLLRPPIPVTQSYFQNWPMLFEHCNTASLSLPLQSIKLSVCLQGCHGTSCQKLC